MKLFTIMLALFFSATTFADLKIGNYKRPVDGSITSLTIKKENTKNYRLEGKLRFSSSKFNIYELPFNTILEKKSTASYTAKAILPIVYEFQAVCRFVIEIRIEVDGQQLFISTYTPTNLPTTLENNHCPTNSEVEYAWEVDKRPYIISQKN